jgi:esterase/lipase superfamily enzyme
MISIIIRKLYTMGHITLLLDLSSKLMRPLLVCLLSVYVAACAGKPDNIVGVDNPGKPAASVVGATRHTVYIATTRARADDPAVLFSGERDLVSVNFAKVVVSIPPGHKGGNVERPTSVPPDPQREFVILEPEVFAGAGEFKGAINQILARRNPGQREILFFVHGYNTDLVAAVLRTAQFKHDSGFAGIPVVFSWASRGRTLDYVYDLNSALYARDDLLATAELVASTRTEGLNIVAHSMGSFLTVEAMRQDQLRGGFNNSGKIRTIVLASPDIDADVFAKQLQPFPKSERKFYVLISENDKALAVSRRIAGGVDRVGDEPGSELAKLGVTVIDLTKIDDTSSLNHTKFASSPDIVQLIGQRMNEGDSFDDSQRRNVFQILPAAVKVVSGPGVL